MTVTDVSHRSAAASRRLFKPAAASLDGQALSALYAALKEADGSPSSPANTPTVSLHRAGGRRQTLETDTVAPDGPPVFHGAGGDLATRAAAAADQAADVAYQAMLAAAGGDTSGFIDTRAADDFAREARSAAAAATVVARTAEQAARANPGDAGLARAAREARQNAGHALDYATRAQASRATTYRIAAQLLLSSATDMADTANQVSNDAINAAADRLEAAGGDPATVAALRALISDSAPALHDAGDAASDAVFQQAIDEAEALEGGADAAAAVRAAQQVRAYALVCANEAVDAISLYWAAGGTATEVQSALADVENSEPHEIGARFAAFNRARAAADQASRDRVDIAVAEDAATNASLSARVEAEQSGLMEIEPMGDPLRVQEPQGEPGELDPGGTDVTIDEVVPAQAHSDADAALGEAGTAAGTAVHTDIRAAAATHGPANRADIAGAAEVSLWKGSRDLAAQMLKHPAVKSALRLTGRGLEGAALTAMVLGLAKAIHTDVKNGDHSAPATRKALAELLGGLSLGVGGAAVGARVGAALGALVGPVTAAVGGFVGGLFGGALGFAAGTRLVDRALENNKKPLDHLIDSVLDQQGDIAAVNIGAIGALQTLTGSGGGDDQSLPGGAPQPQAQPEAPAQPSQDQLNLAQRVVQAGSTSDGYANRKELIAGFEEARYDLKAGQDGSDFTDAFAVNRLIATYGASGSGALTEDELAQALADGALVIHDDGTVTVDTAVLQAQQRSQAGHIASRVVDAGAKAESADESDLRDGFGEAGYRLNASGEDIDALMRVFGDGNGRIGKSELAAAIQVGAVVIAADGTVTVDRAVLDLA
ncbi:MAG: hypothetical protein H0W40_07080 [Methylibium sp.]|uniref:hypothetical protein n=1 Tax=Methylibium sp. TaxID=2067992 RepID=UPI0017C31441|nr:hypothetical protein [Methylibium sp.]MBA3597125.1 hypothetical protein [Methylibium sp.]